MAATSPVNVLIVEDHADGLVALRAVLDDPAYRLVGVRNASDALRHLLGKDEFAVVVLDVKLPDMSGFEVASMMRQRKKTQHTPIIFLTGHARQEVKMLQGYALGAADYLVKPPLPAILRAKVAVFVELFRMRADLASQTARLRATLREQEEFSYSLSHDLRTPLRAVVAFAGLIEHDHGSSLSPEVVGYLRRIASAGQTMTQLIDDIQRFAMLGRDTTIDQAVPLAQVLAEIATAEQAQLADTGGVLDIAAEMPIVRGDWSLIRVIFSNLVDNGLKYRQTGVPPRVAVSAEHRGENAVVCVADNGIGIESAYQTRVFEIFQRLHSSAEYPGTGIGLAMVKKSVDLLGGSLWVESAVGAGSRFFVQLPMAA
jgi:two-component system sensor histidine kinase/response regulator